MEEKKGGITHLNIIFIMFLFILGGLMYLENDARERLNNTNQLLKITISAAIQGKVSADSLEKEYLKIDSIINK